MRASSVRTTLNQLVRNQILSEGPDIASSRDQWTHQKQLDGVLNAMTNAELLERISDALEAYLPELGVRLGI
jgi:hypothetical protein